MHKNTKLLPYQRRELYRRWCAGEPAADLARRFGVSRKTAYAVFRKAKLGVFVNYSSKNLRYRTLEFGFKRLARTETKVAQQLGKRARRLNRYRRECPGELVHADTSVLPLLRGEAGNTPREYLYVFVDDHSRFFFADIMPDQTSWSAAIVLEEARVMLPFPVAATHTDNGSEFKGAFATACTGAGIRQHFTRPYRPQTNGKAERAIKTIKQELLAGCSHRTREERRRHLYAFARWYNHLRPHQSLGDVSPMTCLEQYLARTESALKGVTNA